MVPSDRRDRSVRAGLAGFLLTGISMAGLVAGTQYIGEAHIDWVAVSVALGHRLAAGLLAVWAAVAQRRTPDDLEPLRGAHLPGIHRQGLGVRR